MILRLKEIMKGSGILSLICSLTVLISCGEIAETSSTVSTASEVSSVCK